MKLNNKLKFLITLFIFLITFISIFTFLFLLGSQLNIVPCYYRGQAKEEDFTPWNVCPANALSDFNGVAMNPHYEIVYFNNRFIELIYAFTYNLFLPSFFFLFSFKNRLEKIMKKVLLFIFFSILMAKYSYGIIGTPHNIQSTDSLICDYQSIPYKNQQSLESWSTLHIDDIPFVEFKRVPEPEVWVSVRS